MPRRLEYIQRIEIPPTIDEGGNVVRGATNGWQARPPGEKWKLFSDRKHGGKDAAKKKAERHVRRFLQLRMKELE